MTWPWWTDEHWLRLEALCAEDGIDCTRRDLEEIAEGYMQHGSDGGGNQWGALGTVVALNVDRVARARWQEHGRGGSA